MTYNSPKPNDTEEAIYQVWNYVYGKRFPRPYDGEPNPLDRALENPDEIIEALEYAVGKLRQRAIDENFEDVVDGEDIPQKSEVRSTYYDRIFEMEDGEIEFVDGYELKDILEKLLDTNTIIDDLNTGF